MKSWFTHAQPLALMAAMVVVVGACDEKLDSGLACPVLCPHQQAGLQQDTLDAVVLDTSVVGFPGLGSEVRFFIASMGDTLESMAVVRYDSLPTMFRYSSTAEDSLIYAADSAQIKLLIVTGDTLGPPTTIEIYDVDLGGPDDTDPEAVTSAFTADRLLGARTYPADSLRDSAVVSIDAARLLTKIQADSPSKRLRIGIKVNSSGGGATHLTALSSDDLGAAAILRFRPHTDTAVAMVSLQPQSRVPENPFVRRAMADYLVVAKGPPAPPADVVRVGGLPGRRVYLRFDIPSTLIDSSNVVRATLVMTQRPNPLAPQSTDSVAVQEFQIVASPAITDLTRALLFAQRFRSLDSIRVVAADSGLREFEIIDLVRSWRGTTAEKTPRAMALAVRSEGTLPRLVDFFSIEAPASVRPRLVITYLPRVAGGLP